MYSFITTDFYTCTCIIVEQCQQQLVSLFLYTDIHSDR